MPKAHEVFAKTVTIDEFELELSYCRRHHKDLRDDANEVSRQKRLLARAVALARDHQADPQPEPAPVPLHVEEVADDDDIYVEEDDDEPAPISKPVMTPVTHQLAFDSPQTPTEHPMSNSEEMTEALKKMTTDSPNQSNDNMDTTA